MCQQYLVPRLKFGGAKQYLDVQIRQRKQKLENRLDYHNVAQVRLSVVKNKY